VILIAMKDNAIGTQVTGTAVIAVALQPNIL
jgi:hypothetical protein